jgi:hypothetical protein
VLLRSGKAPPTSAVAAQVHTRWPNLKGCIVFGGGGWGDMTSVVVVPKGTCRSQVWVLDSVRGDEVLLESGQMGTVQQGSLLV